MASDLDFDLTPPPRGDEPREVRTPDKVRAHQLRTIDVMHRRYGVASPGVTCGACMHLVRSGGGDGSFPKCKAFRISCSVATDWRLRWPACGKFTPREEAASNGE